MHLIKALLTCILCLLTGLSHAANNYQDWWWNPAQSGMGLNIGQQNDSIFVAWFNYGDDTKASFLTMGGVLNGNTLTGTLYRGTGPVPGPNYNPAQVKQTAVGTATITFNSNNDATLIYSYDNKGGTMALQRFSFATPNFNQSWTLTETITQSGCATSSMNGGFTTNSSLKGQQGTDSKVTLTHLDSSGGMCVATLTSQPTGSRWTGPGNMVCDDGTTANIIFEDLSIQSNYLTASFTISGISGIYASCVRKGYMAGVVKNDSVPTYDAMTAFKNKFMAGFSKTMVITGDCTGTFSKTNAPAVKTTWNGQSVYAVATTEITSSPTCTSLNGVKTSVTYFNLDFVEIATTNSDGTYSDFVGTLRPSLVKVGDTGTMGTWSNWKDSTKKIKNDIDQITYVIEPDSASSVIFNRVDRTYDNNSVLKRTTQVKFRLTAAGDFDWISVIVDIPDPKFHMEFH